MSQTPKLKTRYIRLQTYIPKEWEPKIKKYMIAKGYISIADLLRDLIRKEVIENGE